jgi:hypothetical protein
LLGVTAVATVPVMPLRTFGGGGGLGLVNHAVGIRIRPTEGFRRNRLCQEFRR